MNANKANNEGNVENENAHHTLFGYPLVRLSTCPHVHPFTFL